MGAIVKSFYDALQKEIDAIIESGPGQATPAEMEIYGQAQERAKRSNGRISFDLSHLEFAALVTRAAGRCEETHLPFSDRFEDRGTHKHPERMSLDRIDSNEGYNVRNIMMVGQSVNYVKGRMASADLLRIAHQIFVSKGYTISNSETGDILDPSADWIY